MKLTEVIGQSHLVMLFTRLLKRGRLPQTILLEGRPGTGRRTLGLAIAQAHLCHQPSDGDACGQCESCRLVAAGGHPDLVSLPHDTELSDIPVARVRDEIVAKAQDSALMSHGRVFFLPSVERLRPDSCNALLKVLEEPAEGTVFILSCAQRQSVLSTIRSRSQCYRLNALLNEHLITILQKQGCSLSDAERLAQFSAGSHRGLATDATDLPPAPLAELKSLLTKGYDVETLALIAEQLPQSVPSNVSLSLPAYRRLHCQQWLEQLLQIIRQELRERHDDKCLEWIGRIVRQQRDVAINIDPRFVLEGLAIAV